MEQSAGQEVSLAPLEGWHCSHLFYRFDRSRLPMMNPAQIAGGREQLIELLNPTGPNAPERLQTSIVSGHKADFGVMMLDANPLKISGLHQRIMASCLGPAIVPDVFVHVDHRSIGVRTDRGAIRPAAGRRREQPDSPAYKAKLKAYENREVMMKRQRLTPELPPWPSTCFYPMNKKRKVGENWFLLPLPSETD